MIAVGAPLRDDLVDQIMHVMAVAFEPVYGEAWNRRQISDALVMPSTHAILIDHDGLIIELNANDSNHKRACGFILSRHAADEEELLLIAVNPSNRGKGLGRQLIQHLFEKARARSVNRIFLEMRRGNPAIHLYEKTGFKPIGNRPDYYRMTNGERVDAITFGCQL